MYCPNCGAEIEDWVKFCPGCGTKLDQLNKTENAVIEKSEQSVSPKSRMTVLMLAIFLGEIGINNFYLGNLGEGFCKVILYFIGMTVYVNGIQSSSVGALLLGFLFISITSAWKICEIVRIARGNEKDGNKRPVKNWEN